MSTNEHILEKTEKAATKFIQNLNKITKIDTTKKSTYLNPGTDSSEFSKSPIDSLPSKMENIEVQNMEMKVPPDSFTPLEAAAISCILQECLDQLAIIEFMIPANVDPRWDDTFKTIDETYGVPDEPRIIFKRDMGLSIISTEAEKLQRDRNYVYKVLEKVLHEIKSRGTFDSLREENDNIAKKQEGERNLEESAETWLSQVKELRELLESDKKANEEDRKRTIELAQESDAQIDYAIFLNNGKMSYAEKWAKARLEQQELKLHREKKDMLNKINEYSKEYNAEQIVSAETIAFLETNIKEKEEQIDMWTKKYNKEIVEKQQEIDELQSLIEEQNLEMEKMRDLMDKRQKFIEERNKEEKLNKAATRIQSIWRGHMVRQELGEYKDLRQRLRKRKKLDKRKKKMKPPDKLKK
ncbi:hypothetical protein P5V15_003775 [Pogonomyrmex californicus]